MRQIHVVGKCSECGGAVYREDCMYPTRPAVCAVCHAVEAEIPTVRMVRPARKVTKGDAGLN